MIADTQGQGTITDNTAPTITDIPDQIITENGTAGPLPFTIGDAERRRAAVR
jgi:hypothetical protein